MNITEAFKVYGASLKNRQWSVSAENAEGELVVSLWQHHFRYVGNAIHYVDNVSRWSRHGNIEFRERIEKAHSHNQVVRVIIARTNDENAVEAGKDASKLKNTFFVKKDWFGKVISWDGDEFVIKFSMARPNA